jgi:hypothetical protein
MGEAANAVIMPAFDTLPRYEEDVEAPLPCVKDGQHPGSLSLHPTTGTTRYEPSESKTAV